MGMRRDITDMQLAHIARDMRADPAKLAIILASPLRGLLFERAEAHVEPMLAPPPPLSPEAENLMREMQATDKELTLRYDTANAALDALAARKDLTEPERKAIEPVRAALKVERTRSYRLRADRAKSMAAQMPALAAEIELVTRQRLPNLKDDIAALVAAADLHWAKTNARAAARAVAGDAGSDEPIGPREHRALIVSALEMLREIVKQDVAMDPEQPRDQEQLLFATLDDYPTRTRKPRSKPAPASETKPAKPSEAEEEEPSEPEG